MLTMGIFNYSEVKNIISVNNNDNISIYSLELQVHIWTSAVNGLKIFDNYNIKLFCDRGQTLIQEKYINLSIDV